MITLNIPDMHCASCVAGVEKRLMSVEGVTNAKVNFASRQAFVEGKVDSSVLIAAVKTEGYGAVLAGTIDHENDNKKQYHKRLRQSLAAAIVGIPLFIDVFFPWLPSATVTHRQAPLIATGILCFIILCYSGRHIYHSMWQSIKALKGNMNTLIGIGIGVALAYSMLVVLVPNLIPVMARHIYFHTAALLIAFVNLGNALEMRARGKTSEALKRLIDLTPKTARVIGESGGITETEISFVEAGNHLQLLPGETVAVDGIVVENESHINESMLTGEPLPIHKSAGDSVYAGTLNQTGSLIYKATGVGSNTALSRIIKLVEQAQGSKPAIGKLVDKVAGYFVPFVLCIAIFTAIAWALFGPEPKSAYMLTTTIAVLVIACPCALGLATPMSIMVGVGKAAEFGILIRNGESLQVANSLDTIVLDKTGTITEGKPSVSNIEGDIETLQIAASLEAQSEHPLGTAILDKMHTQNVETLSVTQFEAIAGFGVMGKIKGNIAIVGNEALMSRKHIDITQLVSTAKRFRSDGKSVVFVAYNGHAIGLIAISDAIKPSSVNAIIKLRQMGLDVMMLTGDNARSAKAIGAQVGIVDIITGVLPHQKLDEIKKLQAEGKTVAMAGDGINDAAALAGANLGIAMGGGTDVAIESADMVLMSGSLDGVVSAIDASKAVMRNIKQNLFFAFVYNTAGIPIAAGVLYPFTHLLLSPIIAGAAMALSSVTVVMNANRLRFLERSS